jgi:hypothetical protein
MIAPENLKFYRNRIPPDQKRSFNEAFIFASLIRFITMKKLFLIGLILGIPCLLAAQGKFDNTIPQTAVKYFEDRDFTKAAPLFRESYAATGNIFYFKWYIQCLSELQDFEKAESELKKEIRKIKPPLPDLLIEYGYILGLQKKTAEAAVQYDEAIRITPPNKNSILNTANQFLQWREYERAEKVYDKGAKELPKESFQLELAQVHLLLRNYHRMMNEIMDAVRLTEENLVRVQGLLTSALYLDIDNGLREEFRKALIKRIQVEPAVVGYNRLLIWFYLQEKQFAAALRQTVALDRRTGSENQQILAFAQMALNNNFFTEASSALEYILSKGKDNTVFFTANYLKLHADYLNFTLNNPGNLTQGKKLAADFENGLEILGYNAMTFTLVREYAHLLSFYLNNSEKAKTVLNRELALPLRPEQWGELKTELADVNINAGDPYEAILLYSQVIDANRDNTVGDEVKLKKAKLGYYLGNFSWAEAQLDVLKASTSKLTANDAMELEVFIRNNSGQDSTLKALSLFARADLLLFRNQDSLAVALLDSIRSVFADDLLVDDILLRKARTEVRKSNYGKALSLLDEIVKDYSGDLLADDALFMEAEIYQYRLKDTDKAAAAYKKILFDYSGSIYVSEARKRYRELTGAVPDNAGVGDQKQEKEILHGNTAPGY